MPEAGPSPACLFAEAWPVSRTTVLAVLELDEEKIPQEPLFTFEQSLEEGFSLC